MFNPVIMADCVSVIISMAVSTTPETVQGKTVLYFIVYLVFVETKPITEVPVRLSWPDHFLLEFLPVFSISVLQSTAYVHTGHP